MKRGRYREREKDKRGQFYLIAAIVLALVIIGIAAIVNYSKKETDIRLYDLGEELKIESANVLDFGVYNEFDETELNDLLEQLIISYIDYEGGGRSLYFIFGNMNNITVMGYQELAETVTITSGGENPLLITEESGDLWGSVDPAGNKVEISIGKIVYEFKLKRGENFYFVISQEIGGEDYVVTG
jgi:hypothetical protein